MRPSLAFAFSLPRRLPEPARAPAGPGDGTAHAGRAPAWLAAADWPDTLPGCFRSEAFAEDLPEPGAGDGGRLAAA